VQKHSPQETNEAIRQQTERNVECLAKAGPEAIRGRLAELEREWDIERALEANAASISLLGLTFGTFGSRRWFALPLVVSGFLLQHALQGWCPPISAFRRLGMRTASEIEYERCRLLGTLGVEPSGGDLAAAGGSEGSTH